MLSDLYLVQGVFFQEREWFGVVCKPIEGNVVVIHSGICRFLFSGVIERDPNHVLGGYLGQLHDVFGEASLTEVVLTEDKLRFVKQYEKRDDTINYQFTKQQDGTWIGRYDGTATGGGYCRCILAPVTASFFELPEIERQQPLLSSS